MIAESTIESAAPPWPESLGWAVRHGPEISPNGHLAERANYPKVVLARCPVIINSQGIALEALALAEIRVALLPKLIRGSIRIKVAEQFLKEREL